MNIEEKHVLTPREMEFKSLVVDEIWNAVNKIRKIKQDSFADMDDQVSAMITTLVFRGVYQACKDFMEERGIVLTENKDEEGKNN